MTKKIIFAVIILCFLLLSAFSACAEVTGSTTDPSEIGVGARPLGMGKAFVAESTDTSGIFINPSGLAKCDSLKFGSMSATLINDYNYVVLGGAYPFDFGTLGIGYINVGTSGIPLTELVGSPPDQIPVQVGSTNYNTGVFFLSYGSKLDRFIDFDFAPKTSIGGSAKVFIQGFSGGGASLEGASGTGIDIDLGAQYELINWVTLGLSLQNCLPASLGGKIVWERNNIEESIPMVIKSGSLFRIFGSNALYPSKQQFNVGLDTDISYGRKRPQVWHLGCEWSPVIVLALRLGIDQSPSASSVENNLTGGVGIRYRGYTFDYAYHQYSGIEENVTHYFSLGYVGEEKEEEFKRVKEVIKPVLEVKPKLLVKTFADVPEGYWAKAPIEYFATLGIIGGYPDGTFRPEEPLNRAEICAVLVKALGEEVSIPDENPFPDVPRRYWGAKYIKKATELKLMGGFPDGLFKPGERITRAEAVIIFGRFAKLKEKKAVITAPFPDLSPRHWASPMITSAKEAGLLDYLKGKNFDPNKELTRAEAAEILSKTEFGKAKIKKLLEKI